MMALSPQTESQDEPEVIGFFCDLDEGGRIWFQLPNPF